MSMGMNFELKIEQAQKLVMTQELQQAIALLQFSAVELMDYIQEEITNNPVLDVQEKESNVAEDEREQNNNEEFKEEGSFDWEEYFNDYEPYHHRGSLATNNEAGSPPYDYYLSREANLTEHLLSQLRLSTEDRRQYSIGEYIIGNLDAAGYLQGEVDDHISYLNVTREEFYKALQLVQGFDPVGVGARSLEECLLLQLRQLGKSYPLAEEVIKNYLPDLAKGKCRNIAEKLKVCPKELQKAVDLIRTLNPKPGAYLGGGDEVKYIVPDVIVEKVEGDFVIIINDNIPQLTISPFYRSLLRQEKEENISKFIKKRMDSAMWLIKSIEQRRVTLYKVTEQIVKIQRPYFEKGIHYLKPLTLKEVADRIGIHESTVSRATTNKYVQTPRGLFSLKYFFSGGISGIRGEMHSVLSIKSHLKNLIEKEDDNSPLSDQRLVELLREWGIKISRRTVTKYREEMGISASFKRRRV
ncbi:MAG: RNA polymerase factor sigma-54 [Dethiobacteria bacterium]|jgi:RNA polymerase sigma-54 factor